MAKKITTALLIEHCEQGAERLLRSILKCDITKASLRDRAVAAGVLIDKMQLLSGEPTQIIDNTKREQIETIIPKLLEEFRRRGGVVDLTPAEYSEINVVPKARAITPEGKSIGPRKAIA